MRTTSSCSPTSTWWRSAPNLQAGSPDRLDDAEIVAAAPCEDLALLQVEGLDDRSAIELGREAEMAQGDPVVALGYPRAPRAGGRSPPPRA